MLKGHKYKCSGRLLGACLLLIVTLFAAEADAALVVDAATVDGGPSTTVAAGGTISLSITVTTSGGGASDDWGSTGWLIASASGTLICIDHANYNSSGTFTETFNIIAPGSLGTYNVYLVAFRKDDCSGNASIEFVLPAAVTVPAIGFACDAYLDQFSAASYANQDGNLNWSLDWNEVGDGGSPASGSIL